HLVPGNHGTKIDVVLLRGPHAQRSYARDEPLHESIVHATLDYDSRCGGADLAGVEERARCSLSRCAIEIAVRKKNTLRRTVQYETALGDIGRRRTHDGLAGLWRARERNLVDARVRHQRAARLSAKAWNDIENPGWKARFQCRSAQPESG